MNQEPLGLQPAQPTGLALSNWKAKILLIGAAIGAAVGVVAAYLYIQNNTIDENPPQITPGEGVKLGVLVFGLLRSIAALGETKPAKNA